jgi:hypothetical protein
MSRRRRLILLTILGLAVLVVLATLGLYLAAHHEPEFYRQALQVEPAVLAKQSDRMLQQTTALASAVRKEGHWQALFTAEQINGWFAVDMLKNHPHAMPATLHDPRVTINPKQVTIACRFENRGIESVLSLTVEPYVPEPNVVALRIVRVRAGLLPLPLGQIVDRFSEAARAMRLGLTWRRAGGDPVAMLSLPDADDDQPVRIETIRLGDGEIYLAGTTQAKKP